MIGKRCPFELLTSTESTAILELFPLSDFNSSTFKVCKAYFYWIIKVIDIEEMAWAPRYGLKGMIDASLRIIMTSSCGDSYEKIMPLEFKTGKGTTGQVLASFFPHLVLNSCVVCFFCFDVRVRG